MPPVDSMPVESHVVDEVRRAQSVIAAVRRGFLANLVATLVRNRLDPWHGRRAQFGERNRDAFDDRFTDVKL